MSRPLSLSGLRVFEAAARLESFALAANELGVSPAAVSRAIRRLEHELGFDLFYRSHRSVSLTDAGGRYAQQVTEGFRHFTPTRFLFAPQRASVSLDVEATFLRQWLIPRLGDADFRELGISPQFRAHHDVPRVIAADTDLAIVWCHADYSGFKRKRLVSPTTVLVAAPSCGVTELKDAAEAGLIHEGNEHWWRLVYDEAGLPYPEGARSITVNRCDIPIHAAAMGLGVAVGDDVIAEQELKTGAVIPVDGPRFDGQDYYLMVRIGASVPARNFADWLVAKAKEFQARAGQVAP